MAHPVGSHIIICPRCKLEIERTVWRDGSKLWFQCARCGYYGEVTEGDFVEDDDE